MREIESDPPVFFRHVDIPGFDNLRVPALARRRINPLLYQIDFQFLSALLVFRGQIRLQQRFDLKGLVGICLAAHGDIHHRQVTRGRRIANPNGVDRDLQFPGPPRELRPMFTTEVLPRLATRFPLSEPFACRTLKTTGLGESYMEERLEGPLRDLVAGGMDLGFCARVGEVDVRFVARGPNAAAVVAEAEHRTRKAAGEYIFGSEDDTLEKALVDACKKAGLRLALAESCTGGHMANRVTNVPGASAVFMAGWVTYSNEAKERDLGVPKDLLREHGAVSEPVARAMAEGARSKAGADIAIAITGIAGPSGAVDGKPVGTVFVAVAHAGGTVVSRQLNAFDRETFKYVTCQQAMAMALRVALGEGPSDAGNRS